jgi:two-component system OmpR family sensor kinase
MTTPRHSLLKSMLKSLLLPGVAAGIVGLLIVFNLVKQEYDELQDFALTSKAHLLLDLFEASQSANATAPTLDLTALLAVENATLGPD